MSSSLPIFPSLLALSIAYLLFIFLRPSNNRKGVYPLPPGPRGLPVLGNTLSIPQENEWVFYSGLLERYGPLIHLSVLGMPYLVIGSLRTASDLFEHRSSLYSGRLNLSMGGALDGWKRSMLLQDGPAHRGYRRFAKRGLGQGAVKGWEELQEVEAGRTLRRVLEDPGRFGDHFRANAAAVIMMVAYGHSVTSEDDPYVREVREMMDEFSVLFTPAKLLLDYIPFIKYVPEWVPGMGYKKTVREWKVKADRTFDAPYQATKARMAAGTAVPCMTTQLLSEKKADEIEDHITGVAGTLFQAGADTSASAMTVFVLAMVRYPDVQKRAQAELDAVVGSDRLPLFADKERLPYLNALVKEVLRWFPIVPLGFPHRCTEEDVYEGYRIPKDSLIIVNIWHMARDKETYGPDADQFNPSRFLGPDPAPRGFKTPQTTEFGSPAFGFGRRLCPDQHLAMATLFILCSSILATFDILPEVGEDGRAVLPELEATGGVIVYPKPFKCRIVPRSEKAVALIKESQGI